jgi:membrane-bound lytic murein transglycosylase D
MRTKVARSPLWVGLLFSPAVALAQTKPGSLPEAKSPAKAEAKAPAPAAEPKPTKQDSKPPPKAEATAAPKPAPKPTPKAEPEAEPSNEPAATSKPAADLARGSGSRSVGAPAPEAPQPPAATVDAKAPSKTAHQKGRPPSKPSPTLPPGSARPAPDESAREHITGGAPTDDAIRRGKDDPELSSLREAERVLFPRPLAGVELGFDFAPRSTTGPEVDASGLPVGAATSAEAAAASASEAAWLRSLSQPDLPVRYDERVVRYLRFYRDTPSGRAIARTWTKKAGRFAPAIKAELGRAGLPTDLVWLSLIESSHNPTIASPVGAAGCGSSCPTRRAAMAWSSIVGSTSDSIPSDPLKPPFAT